MRLRQCSSARQTHFGVAPIYGHLRKYNKVPVKWATPIDKLIDIQSRGEAADANTYVTPLLPLNVSQVLVSGVYNGIAAPIHAWRYREKARAKNEIVQLVTINNAGPFELIAPWTDAGRLVVQQIIAATKIGKSTIGTSQ